MTDEQRRKREADDLEHEHEAAMAAGRGETLLEIERRAEELKSAAFDGPPTLASRKAEGALLLWRAAYAAAYRELLMVEELDRSLAHGARLPPSITSIPSSAPAIMRPTSNTRPTWRSSTPNIQSG